jgi:hypothetical protein
MFFFLFLGRFYFLFFRLGSKGSPAGFKPLGSWQTSTQAFSDQGQVAGLQVLVVELRLYFPGDPVKALKFRLAGIKKMLERYVHNSRFIGWRITICSMMTICRLTICRLLNIDKRNDIHKTTKQLKHGKACILRLLAFYLAAILLLSARLRPGFARLFFHVSALPAGPRFPVPPGRSH